MSIRVSKPSFSIREKLSELERPIGLKGSELMRAETAQEARDFVSAGRKNLIINGDMRIAQRGSSFTHSSVVKSYPADRMEVNIYNTGFIAPTGGTSSWVDVSTSEIVDQGFYKAARFTPNSSWKLCYFSQKIENVATISDDFITISYWMRIGSGSVTFTDNARISQNFGSGGSSTYDFYISRNREVTTQWKKFSDTYYLPSIKSKTIGTSSYIEPRIFQSLDLSVLNGTWLEVTGVQAERGKNATEFEHRSYGEELALCQRYFYKTRLSDSGNNYSNAIMALGATENRLFVNFKYPVPMRGVPAITMTRPSDNATNGAHKFKAVSGSDVSAVDVSFSNFVSAIDVGTLGFPYFNIGSTVSVGSGYLLHIEALAEL